MRHNISGKKLGRDTAHRKALLRNLSTSLIEKGSVVTTLAKAKYVRPYVERLVTKARVGGFSSLKVAKQGVTHKEAVRKLVSEIAPSFSSRPGGYTRIKKLGRRSGDNAEMAKIEWVTNKENVSALKKRKQAKLDNSNTASDAARNVAKPVAKSVKEADKAETSKAKLRAKQSERQAKAQKKVVRTSYE